MGRQSESTKRWTANAGALRRLAVANGHETHTLEECFVGCPSVRRVFCLACGAEGVTWLTGGRAAGTLGSPCPYNPRKESD